MTKWVARLTADGAETILIYPDGAQHVEWKAAAKAKAEAAEVTT